MFKKHALGNQLLALIAILLLFPVFLTLYMLHVIQSSELSLVEYQKNKLSRALDELDDRFAGSFADLLKQHGARDKSKQEQVRILNAAVKAPIETVSREYPRVDLGFYVISLDVILDGSDNYEENFSRRRKALFQETLTQQSTVVHTIGQTSAGMLEMYKPIYRQGQLEGIVWASENMAQTNFYRKVKQVERDAYTIIVVAVFLGLGTALLLIHNFVTHVNQIKKGVRVLESDLRQNLPETPGELGEISQAVNRLAGKLVEMYKYNEIMLATIDDGLLVVDKEGQAVITNPAAGHMLDLVCDGPGKHYRDIFPADSPFPDLLARTLQNHAQYKDLVVPWPSPRHGPLQLLVSTALMPDDGGEIIGAVLCCRDITERMRLEDQVHRQERLAALGKLVAGVAHEIRNPLTSISCYIQLWQKTNNPSPKSIQTIAHEMTRLESLVAQLLYFAKPAEASFAPHDLNQVVEKVLQFFTDVPLTRFQLVKKLASQLPPAWLDAEQVERVLMNIIFNACQAMSEGGTLEVGTSFAAPEDALVVRITDTGCGIPETHLKHLFDPFFSTREGGTGLGLAIAYEIVQAHGGRIEVTSKEGRGTTFTIFLRAKKEGGNHAETDSGGR